MKVFISWSGPTSNRIALAFRDWLPCVLQTVDPYVSSEDIEKGRRWSADIAKELGRTGFRFEDLARPTEAVTFGSWYLARQIRDLGQRPVLALAAYNAGPGNARRWAGRNLNADPDDFVFAIDFAETRTYVRSIYEHYAHYRQLYG